MVGDSASRFLRYRAALRAKTAAPPGLTVRLAKYCMQIFSAQINLSADTEWANSKLWLLNDQLDFKFNFTEQHRENDWICYGLAKWYYFFRNPALDPVIAQFNEYGDLSVHPGVTRMVGALLAERHTLPAVVISKHSIQDPRLGQVQHLKTLDNHTTKTATLWAADQYQPNSVIPGTDITMDNSAYVLYTRTVLKHTRVLKWRDVELPLWGADPTVKECTQLNPDACALTQIREFFRSAK